MDIVYNFDNDTLSSVEMKIPELLYNGLQDNIQTEEVDLDDTDSLTATLEMRDSILDKLNSKFNELGVNAMINAETGEVVMDTGILFAVDQYDLSEEGKAYIEEFATAYVTVLLEEDVQRSLNAIVFEGHTDTNGTYNYNLNLSQKRADAVLEYCLSCIEDQLGVEAKNSFQNLVLSTGFSFSDPIYDSFGNVDMNASRRVAVKFFVEIID